jgi:hypothetical protein
MWRQVPEVIELVVLDEGHRWNDGQSHEGKVVVEAIA